MSTHRYEKRVGSSVFAGRACYVILFLVAVLSFVERSVASSGAFTYPQITDPILSASFSVDVASLTAHRSIAGLEVNRVVLFDINGTAASVDLSTALFGTSAFPSPPAVNQGPVETGILSAPIPPSFFPGLALGDIGLSALLTDTGDGMFAIDTVFLTIQTTSTLLMPFYGSPNNGFGIGVPDFGNLPGTLPGALPAGATGTGFDETISSKAMYVPEPSFTLLAALCVCGMARRRSSCQSNDRGINRRRRSITPQRSCVFSCVFALVILASGATAMAGKQGNCTVGTNRKCANENAQCNTSSSSSSQTGRQGECTSFVVGPAGDNRWKCCCNPGGDSGSSGGSCIDVVPFGMVSQGNVQVTGNATALPPGQPIPVAPAVVTLDLSPRGDGILAFLTERFGPFVAVQSPTFAGSIRVASFPTSDPNVDVLETVGGSAVAPSVILPYGAATGTNYFEFLGPGLVEGSLDRITGEFSLTSRGKLTNDLFPETCAIHTIGVYTGTIDMMTGVTTFETTALDFIPCQQSCGILPDQLHVVGPIPNQVAEGSRASITVRLESSFHPMPGKDIYVARLLGSCVFESGLVHPQGAVTTLRTDDAGEATLSVLVGSPGPVLLSFQDVLTPLEAYSFFQVVPATPVVGDVDGDGDIDSVDISLFCNVLLGLEEESPYAGRTDFNHDGSTDGRDIRTLLTEISAQAANEG